MDAAADVHHPARSPAAAPCPVTRAGERGQFKSAGTDLAPSRPAQTSGDLSIATWGVRGDRAAVSVVVAGVGCGASGRGRIAGGGRPSVCRRAVVGR